MAGNEMSYLESEDRKPIQEPKPEDFGLTNESVKKFHELEMRNGAPSNIEGVYALAMFAALGIAGLSRDAVIAVFCLLAWGVFALIFSKSKTIFEYRLKTIPNSYLRFKDANQEYSSAMYELKKEKEKIKIETKRIEQIERRKTFEYWMSVDPYEFESEMAVLFEQNGFAASVTKGSGDGGIDIELKIGTKRGVVQCKRQKTKASPGVVRDLYGTMVAGKYDFAFAVCPAGFSDQTFQFVRGKKIGLIGLKRIIDMAKREEPLDFLRI